MMCVWQEVNSCIKGKLLVLSFFIKIIIAFTEHLLMSLVPIYVLYNPHNYSMRQELVTLLEGWLQNLLFNL